MNRLFVGPLISTGYPDSSLTFYLSGTTTLAPIYSADEAALENPLGSDAYGDYPAVYFDQNKDYRAILKKADSTVVWDIDPANDLTLNAAIASVNAAAAAAMSQISAVEVQVGLYAAAAQAWAAGNAFFASADALSSGVIGTATLVGGSGGTNGTFALGFTGGGGSGAAGVFVVAGGVVTQVTITSKGIGYTSAPTLSFAASSGLSGASATAVIAPRTNAGDPFLVYGSGSSFAELYKNVAGVATDQSLAIPSLAALQTLLNDTVTFGTTAPGATTSGFGFDYGTAVTTGEGGALNSVGIQLSASGTGELVIVDARGPTLGKVLQIVSLPALSSGVNTITSLSGTTVPANAYIIYHRLTGGFICFDNVAGIGNVAYASASHIVGDTVTLVPGSARMAIAVTLGLSLHNTESRITANEGALTTLHGGTGLDQVGGTINVTDTAAALAGNVWSPVPTAFDGWFSKLVVYFSATGSGSVRFYTPNSDGSYTNIGAYPVSVASGANTFSAGTNGIPANLWLPAGSRVGYADVATAPRFANGGATWTLSGDTGLGSTAVLPVIQPVTIKMEVHVRAPSPRNRKPVLIDQRFAGTTVLANWSLTGWTWSSGLVAPATGAWTNVALFGLPTAMDRRLVQARFTVADTTAKFGICFVPPSGYSTSSKLYGSAAVVDGSAGKLQVYQLTQGGVATFAAEVTGIGTLPASVDLQVSKNGMSQTVTLINAVTGQTIATLTHAHTVDTDPRAEFNLGSPGVVFVSGAGGAAPVTCTHFRMNRGRKKRLHAIILGDSMEQGNALGASWASAWPYLLDTARAANDVMNAAQGGSDSNEAAMRLAMDLLPFEPNYVLLKFTNDTVSTSWRMNMQAMINAILSVNATPVLCTLPPSSVGARQTFATAANNDIRSFFFGNYDYIDFAKALSIGHDGVTIDPTLFIADGVHPTVAGNVLMQAQLVRDAPYLLNDPVEA